MYIIPMNSELFISTMHNVHLRIYKSSLKTDLVPLSEILPYKEYVHMYVNYQVYVCYMCTYMYTYIHTVYACVYA